MKDNVWFTYKARIQAHKRLEWLDFHSQLLLVWYAVLSAILGILTIKFEKPLGSNTDVIATALSTALLGISLVIANRDFRVRAINMRHNYLELHKLYSEIPCDTTTTIEQNNKYHELLNKSENHREIDDRIARTFTQGLTTRLPTCYEKAFAVSWLLVRFIITVLLYLSPVVAGFYFWMTV